MAVHIYLDSEYSLFAIFKENVYCTLISRSDIRLYGNRNDVSFPFTNYNYFLFIDAFESITEVEVEGPYTKKIIFAALYLD